MCCVRYGKRVNVAEKGSSLLEVLLVIVIVASLGVIVTKIGSTAVALYYVVKQRYRNELTLLQFKHRLQRVVDDVDSYPFEILPRIHKKNHITYFDGGAVARDIKVAEDSDAITVLSLDMGEVFDVIKQESGKVYACTRNKRSYEHNFGYIGIGADGIIELHGDLESHTGRSGCVDYEIREAQRSMLNKRSSAVGHYINRIIPIKTYYTLYLDSNETLRYLSHNGEKITENQPLFNNVKKVTLSSSVVWGKIFCIEAEITFSDSNSRQVRECNRLGRENYYNFLMNKSYYERM